MRITDQDLKAFPPGEDLIRIVKDAIGMGETARRREAQDALAEAFYRHFRNLIGRRYDAYQHVGATYEMDDNLQRLYMYIIFGYREDSKSRLKETRLPLLTWLKNLEGSKDPRSLYYFVISRASSYLKRDLARNIQRGRGKERLVRRHHGARGVESTTNSQDRTERDTELEAHEVMEREKEDDEDEWALYRHIEECLELMPSEETELLCAIYLRSADEKLTQSQYAQTNGISEGTVSKRLRRAREKLAGLLQSVCPDLLQRLGWSKRSPSNIP